MDSEPFLKISRETAQSPKDQRRKSTQTQMPAGLPALAQQVDVSTGQRLSVPAPPDNSTQDPVLFVQVIPYDRHLLDHARTQWQFGDWESLAGIAPQSFEHHAERAQLALLVAAGHAQHGHSEQARALIRQALAWGADREQAARLLISGVHNSLGRACAIQEHDAKALSHFDASLRVGQPGGAVELRANTLARSAHLGLPRRSTVHLLLDGVAALLPPAERLQNAERPQEAFIASKY